MYSDKTLDQLAKSLRTTFAPQTGSSASIDADNPPIDVLPLSIVKSAISSMATRTNFGLTSSDLDGKEIPNLTVYRWHVDEWEKLVAEGLPSEMVEKLQKRVEEREGLHDIAVGLLDALDEKSKKVLLEGKEKKDAKGKKKEDAIDVDEEKVKKVKKGKGKAEKDASEDEDVEEKVKETPEEVRVKLVTSVFADSLFSSNRKQPRKRNGKQRRLKEKQRRPLLQSRRLRRRKRKLPKKLKRQRRRLM